MGVDYYNCDLCDEIYTTCAGGGSCDSCGASWCDRCNEPSPVFYIGDDKYCEHCYPDPDKKKHHSKREKLDFLLEHAKMTEAELIALMPPLNVEPDYVCTKTEEHGCVQECTTLGHNWEDEDGYQCRGLCCKAKGLHELCEACANTNKKIKA
jgi:hypothetical protein